MISIGEINRANNMSRAQDHNVMGKNRRNSTATRVNLPLERSGGLRFILIKARIILSVNCERAKTMITKAR